MITYSTDIDVREQQKARDYVVLQSFAQGVSVDTVRDSMYPTVVLTAQHESDVPKIVEHLSRGLGRNVRVTELYRKS